MRRFGITPARYDLLYLMWHDEVELQSDLWKRLDVSRMTVSRMLGALEELGLVWRSSRAGRGSRRVLLTEKGKALMEAAVRGCHRPMLLLYESLFADVRTRSDRGAAVAALRGDILRHAMDFGDRSDFSYPHNAPEDVWHFYPDPAERPPRGRAAHSASSTTSST